MDDVIVISSSDSEVEIEDGRATTLNCSRRRFPSWATRSEGNSKFRGHAGLSRRGHSPNTSYGSNGSSHNVNGHMLPLEIQEDGNLYLSQTVDPIIGNISSNQFQNAHGSSSLFGQICSTLSKSYTRDHSVVGNDKKAFMYGINGNWILPSSMINGKSIVATEFATSGDSAHRFGVR